MAFRLCGLAGSFGRPSRARELAAARFGAAAVTYGLADLQPSLGRAATLDAPAPPARALAIEHQTRPLLGLFEAATLPTGAGASDLVDGQPAGPAETERLERAVEQLSPWLGLSLLHVPQEPETAAA